MKFVSALSREAVVQGPRTGESEVFLVSASQVSVRPDVWMHACSSLQAGWCCACPFCPEHERGVRNVAMVAVCIVLGHARTFNARC